MRKNTIFNLIIIIVLLAAVALWIWARQTTPKQTVPVPDSLDKLELIWFVNALPGDTLPESEQDFVLQTIENRFNVNLSLRYMDAISEYEAQISALMHANDPPDFWIDLSADGGSRHALNGILADMTEYVTTLHMPNYFKYWVSERDLKLYQLHNRFFRAPVPYNKNVYRSYYIRNDWIERLGLALPQTYEEYVAVLHAFTYQDPDGNGLADTYGFSVSGNSLHITTDWPEYIKNDLFYPAYMNGNELIDMQSDLRVGQVVDDILKLMNAGVIDPDWFLNQDQTHLDKAAQGKIGVVLGQTADFALDANPQSLQNRSKAFNPDADWRPFNLFGNKPLQTGVDPGHPFVFSKKVRDTAPHKITKSVEILDWLASEEGFLLTHYGQVGKHYIRNGNTISLLPGAEEQALSRIWTFFTPRSPAVFGLQVNDPALSERDQSILEFQASVPVMEKLGVTLNPPLGIDVAPFRTKQNELQVKMMFLDKSGKNWTEYREVIMSQFHGEQILQNFENQIRAARRSK